MLARNFANREIFAELLNTPWRRSRFPIVCLVPVRGDSPRCSGMRCASAQEKIKWLESNAEPNAARAARSI